MTVMYRMPEDIIEVPYYFLVLSFCGHPEHFFIFASHSSHYGRDNFFDTDTKNIVAHYHYALNDNVHRQR